MFVIEWGQHTLSLKYLRGTIIVWRLYICNKSKDLRAALEEESVPQKTDIHSRRWEIIEQAPSEIVNKNFNTKALEGI